MAKNSVQTQFTQSGIKRLEGEPERKNCFDARNTKELRGPVCPCERPSFTGASANSDVCP